MDELGAELDRHRYAGKPARVAAAADPVSCLNDQDRSARARELRGRRQARRPCADDDDILRRFAQAT